MAPESADDAAIPAGAVVVPHARVAADVLRRVLEEFVTREGTDYGAAEKTLEAKIARLEQMLARGEAVLLYDAETETINIVPKDVLRLRTAP